MEQRHYYHYNFLHKKDSSLEFHYVYGIQVDLFGFDMQFGWFDLHKILGDSLEYYEFQDNVYKEFVMVEQPEDLKMLVDLENCLMEIE